MTALFALMSKEMRQTFRDKRMIALLIIAPLMQLIVLGFAVNLDVVHIPLVAVDEDRTPESRRFIEGLAAGDTFDLVAHEDVTGALALVERGAVPVAVIVPRGFSRDLARGRPAQVQALVDGGDSNRAIVAQSALSAYGVSRSLALMRDRIQAVAATMGAAPRFSQVRVEPRVFYNPTLESRIYFVPGVAATLLLIVTVVVTSMGLAREREMGTLEQVMVTPISPVTLVLGKTLPYAVIGLADLGLVVAAGAWIFGVPLRGNLLVVLLGGSLYLLSTLGIGLLLSSIARNQQQAFMGAFFIVMPAILLSGFMTPVQNMPDWLQPLSTVDPVRHFVEVMRAVLLKGAGIGDLLPQLAAMAGIGLTVFLTAAMVLYRRLR